MGKASQGILPIIQAPTPKPPLMSGQGAQNISLVLAKESSFYGFFFFPSSVLKKGSTPKSDN